MTNSEALQLKVNLQTYEPPQTVAQNQFHVSKEQIQLKRILASSQFSKSERLRRFLHFTVFTAVNGDPSVLKESVLAIEVFDRDVTYDPRVDSVVRVQASRLRLKLEEYYRHEGIDDPIEIVYPRGSYVPVFRERSCAADSSEIPSMAPVPVPSNNGNWWKVVICATAWIISLLVVHLVLLWIP